MRTAGKSWRVRLARVLALFLLTTAIVAVSGPPVAAHTVTPVNPNASPDTVRALDFLAHINDHGTRTTQAVASGFFAGYSTGLDLDQSSTPSYPQVLALRAVTGRWPFVLGCDYAQFTAGEPTLIAYERCNSKLRSWWRQGGLPSVSVHMPNPYFYFYGMSFKVPLHDSLMQNVLNPATREGDIWRRIMHDIADGLQNLGVPVLFRPLHEMNGNWFWWTNQNTSRYRELWRSLYNYITNERRLTNVIWVYAPNFERPWGPFIGCSLYNSSADNYYPGNDVVDIVGLDAYTYEPDTNQCLGKDYDALIQLGKPFAFTEIGRGSSPQYCVSAPMDYRKWINAIKTRFRNTVYFLAWNDCFAPQANFHPVEFMRDPVVANRGDRVVTPPATPPPPQPSHKWTSGSTPWDALGGVVKGKVASVSVHAGHLQIFARGSDDRLYTNTQTGGTWGGWQGLGDFLTEPPTALVRAGGIDVYYRGGDTRPYVRRWNGSAWEAAVKLGDIDVAGPITAVSLYGGAHAALFVRTANDEVYSAGHDGTRWSNWYSLGGDVNAPPTAIARPNAAGQMVLEVYARWADDNVRYRRADPSQPGYQPWVNLGGIWKDTPVGVTVGTDHSLLLGIANDNTLHFQQWRDGTWLRGADGGITTGWKGVGGSVYSRPAVIAEPGERVRVFARDANQQINSITWLGGDIRNWERWAPLDGDSAVPVEVGTRGSTIDVLGVDAATGQPFHTTLAGTPATQVTNIDSDVQFQDPAYFVVTGPPGAPVSWSSTRDGVRMEDHAFYGQYLDTNGQLVWHAGQWSSPDVGSWVKQAHVGTPEVQVVTAQTSFAVPHRPTTVRPDKGTLYAGENITYTITGKANQPIFWTSTIYGQPSGEDNAFYNQYTDEYGLFTFTTTWTDPRTGIWTKQVRVGDQTGQINIQLVAPPQLLSQATLTSVYTDVPVGAGKCLDAYPWYDGGNVQQWSCQVGKTWQLNPVGENIYQVVYLTSGKCLDVAGAGTHDGANVQLWTCHGGTNQQWRLSAAPLEWQKVTLTAVHSGKCLDVANASMLDAANVQQWTCNSENLNQLWRLAAPPPPPPPPGLPPCEPGFCE
ncbi:MAG TPA: glycosyl hydrolase [Candidatus Limnocylindrales bacterium]|nr:glycosyl hydrolase [Candidatus Limnocylindrales bacterium]